MLTTDDFRRCFENVDKNKDGLISIDELQNFMKRVGIQTTKEEFEEAKVLVGAQDKLMNFDQFLAFYNEMIEHDKDNGDLLRESFKVYDVNGDGLIDAAELQKVLGNMEFLMTERECKLLIEERDKNGDGLIDFEEFKVMMSASDV